MNDYDSAVGRLAAQMPGCWKSDYRITAAKQIITDNTMHAVDQDVRQFALEGRD